MQAIRKRLLGDTITRDYAPSRIGTRAPSSLPIVNTSQMLPTEIAEILDREFSCREVQIRQITSLLCPTLPSPPAVVLHGLEATGKTAIIDRYLKLAKVPYTIISSRQCITGRHLLERILAACIASVEAIPDFEVKQSAFGRCESLSALVVYLQSLLQGLKKFVLVLDGIDRQRDAPPTLFPALARFGEMISSLTIVCIISVPSSRLLHRPGIPHIHFPAYTRSQAIHILSLKPPAIFLSLNDNYTEEEHDEDRQWLWPRFLVAVWDSLAKGAARDVVQFREIAEVLWEEFVGPIRKGEYGTRDFSRLMVRMRGLFQKEDDLVEGIVPEENQTSQVIKGPKNDLPHFSKYLLCAAYLASYNPARQDPIFFMKSTEKKRRRRGGGGTPGRVPKNRKIPRHLLHPSAFSLDRLLAIVHAIVPHAVPQTADMYTQIATLASLRLLLRAGPQAADMMDSNSKWRVGVGWDVVNGLARSVRLEMADYLAE
ncbi:MAG: hypothetical protein M1822_010053 [Bathelium mastoideum]|nr:MAG: hypothetical protein M1822_010053 [Bathelium mastoideum]